ncbi:MAG: type I secretion C-terminal target domain-containing protein, partial [Leptolyngbyaceae cyanobacterium SL_7_1]|nr:type I secretion C-terminal target domain-containing protein [Leptolyngbyaceae cyanobacterium SL_7_1]
FGRRTVTSDRQYSSFSNNSAANDATQLTDNNNVYGMIEVLPLPTLTLSPPTATIKESPTTSVVYQIDRSHAVGNLTVRLAIGGTASPVDYTVAGKGVGVDGTTISLTIPHGQAAATLTLTPSDDLHAETEETLVLTLLNDDAYLVGAQAQATVTIDANDTVVTTVGDSGEGSLRQAVLNANAAPGVDTITFAAEFIDQSPDSIALTSGPLTITDNAAIVGTEAALLTIDGGGTSQIFDIGSGVTVDISNVTIADGQAVNGGGILNQGVLTLTGAVLKQNFASNDGGAIFNSGSLTVTETLIKDNSSSDSGGAIYNSGDLTMADTTLDSNIATQRRGGLYNTLGAAGTITSTTFANNLGQVGGSSIYNDGSLTLIDSTVVVPTDGGSTSGVADTGIANTGSLTVATTPPAGTDPKPVLDLIPNLPNPIYGYSGADQLVGGLEDDQLVGGGGDDTLTGGFGSDHFIYRSLSEGSDTITDFSTNEDYLNLSFLFNSLNYTGSDPIADGYLSLQAVGQDVLVYGSQTGDGQYSTLLTTLQNVSLDELAVGKNILI